MVKYKHVATFGFTLFAFFFGAGNLIFPPSIGVNTGIDWVIPGLGFLFTAVGLPLLGVLTFVKTKDLDKFASKVSPKFNTIFCSILVLVIGPFFALPRTGSTTFEFAIRPILGGSPSFLTALISSTVFFGISYLFTIKPNKITDILGNFLTPTIFILLTIMFIKGMTTPIGTAIQTNMTENLLAYGVINGYQTMDALASMLFGSVIMQSIQLKGITSEKEQTEYLVISGFIAAFGLGIIYLFLMYFGSLLSGTELSSTTSAALYFSEVTLGTVGRIIFGACVGLACLTTSIGLTAFTASWFSKLTNISYEKLVLVTSTFAVFVASSGVDMIIKLALPVLIFIYPIVTVLILLNIFNMNSTYFKISVFITTVISLIESLGSTFNIEFFNSIIKSIPLGEAGFVWIIPFILSLVISYVINMIISKKETA